MPFHYFGNNDNLLKRNETLATVWKKNDIYNNIEKLIVFTDTCKFIKIHV